MPREGTECIPGVLGAEGSHRPREKLLGAGTAGSLLKRVRAPAARSPGGSRCGRRVDTGVGSAGGQCALTERRVAGAPGPNDSHIQRSAFWLVRRGGKQERGVKERGYRTEHRQSCGSGSGTSFEHSVPDRAEWAEFEEQRNRPDKEACETAGAAGTAGKKTQVRHEGQAVSSGLDPDRT